MSNQTDWNPTKMFKDIYVEIAKFSCKYGE